MVLAPGKGVAPRHARRHGRAARGCGAGLRPPLPGAPLPGGPEGVGTRGVPLDLFAAAGAEHGAAVLGLKWGSACLNPCHVANAGKEWGASGIGAGGAGAQAQRGASAVPIALAGEGWGGAPSSPLRPESTQSGRVGWDTWARRHRA